MSLEISQASASASSESGPFTSATSTYENLRTISDAIAETPVTGSIPVELFRETTATNNVSNSSEFQLHRPPDRQATNTSSLPPDSRAAQTEPVSRKRASNTEDLTRPSFHNLDLNLMQNPILLGDSITPSQATKFREQARARPNLLPADLITGKARSLVRYRLTGDESQQYVPKELLDSWYDLVSINTAADIICRYFSEVGTNQDKPLAESLDNATLSMNYGNEALEDESFYTIEEIIRQHYQTHAEDSDVTQNEHAKILERKLPQNSQLYSDYVARKALDMAITGGKDSPGQVIKRIKICIAAVRSMRKKADAYGNYNDTFSSRTRAFTSPPGTIPTTRSEASNHDRCQMCGLHEHEKLNCIYGGFPDVNTSGALWSESAVGERWKIFGHPAYRSDLTLPRGEKAGKMATSQPEAQNQFDHNDPANILLKQAHKAEKIRKRDEFNNRGGNNKNNYNPYNNNGGNGNNYNSYNQGGNQGGNQGENHNGNNLPNNNGGGQNNNNNGGKYQRDNADNGRG